VEEKREERGPHSPAVSPLPLLTSSRQRRREIGSFLFSTVKGGIHGRPRQAQARRSCAASTSAARGEEDLHAPHVPLPSGRQPLCRRSAYPLFHLLRSIWVLRDLPAPIFPSKVINRLVGDAVVEILVCKDPHSVPSTLDSLVSLLVFFFFRTRMTPTPLHTERGSTSTSVTFYMANDPSIQSLHHTVPAHSP
jgi:hypothetical protein